MLVDGNEVCDSFGWDDTGTQHCGRQEDNWHEVDYEVGPPGVALRGHADSSSDDYLDRMLEMSFGIATWPWVLDHSVDTAPA